MKQLTGDRLRVRITLAYLLKSMKPLFRQFTFALCFSYGSLTAMGQEIRYLDEKGIPISQADFKKALDTRSVLAILIDSAGTQQLIGREHQGNLNPEQFKELIEALEANSQGRKVEWEKLIVIDYYPGPDPCNRGGSASKQELRAWHAAYHERLRRIAGVEPFYVYKSEKGLKQYKGILHYQLDHNQTVEKLFFQHHYPCGSFVVIAPDGRYMSYFGEYPKELVWKYAMMLNPSSSLRLP